VNDRLNLKDPTPVLMALWAVPVTLVVALAAAAVIPWWAAILVGLAAGVGVAWWRRSSADRRVAAAIGGIEVDEASAPRLANLVNGACLHLGMEAPEVRVLESPAVNAGVSGSEHNGVVYVTEGAVGRLDLVELEALVMHQLLRLRRGDGTVASGVYSFLTTIGLGNLAPRFIPEQADLAADLDAVGATRYPPALAEVLAEAQSSAADGAGTLADIDVVWMAPVSDNAPRATPTSTRIAVLREL
jgi:Zn-dependent protease with chaperone function